MNNEEKEEIIKPTAEEINAMNSADKRLEYLMWKYEEVLKKLTDS